MLFEPDRRLMPKGRNHVIPQHFAVLDNLLLIFSSTHDLPADCLPFPIHRGKGTKR